MNDVRNDVFVNVVFTQVISDLIFAALLEGEKIKGQIFAVGQLVKMFDVFKLIIVKDVIFTQHKANNGIFCHIKGMIIVQFDKVKAFFLFDFSDFHIYIIAKMVE